MSGRWVSGLSFSIIARRRWSGVLVLVGLDDDDGGLLYLWTNGGKQVCNGDDKGEVNLGVKLCNIIVIGIDFDSSALVSVGTGIDR